MRQQNVTTKNNYLKVHCQGTGLTFTVARHLGHMPTWALPPLARHRMKSFGQYSIMPRARAGSNTEFQYFLKKKRSTTLTFHDDCFSKPLTVHNGFTEHCTGMALCQHHFKPSWKKINIKQHKNRHHTLTFHDTHCSPPLPGNPWSNCLNNSREDDKGQTNYYSVRRKDNSKTSCGRPG